MILLGISQTFLGSLLTVIVLLLVKTNFIDDILIEKVEEVKKQLKELFIGTMSMRLLFSVNEIKTSTSYKLIGHYSGKKNQHLCDKISEFNNEFNEFADNFNEKNTKKNLESELMRMDGITNSTERLLSSLFTVCFILVIFIFDEVFAVVGENDWLLSSLGIFVMLSSIFWIVLWVNFYLKTAINRDNKRKNSNIARNYPKSIFKYGLLYLFVVALSLYLAHLVPSWAKFVLWIGIICTPITLGCTMINKRCRNIEFHKVSMLVHFTILLIISLTVSLIVFVPIWLESIPSDSILIVDSLWLCKWAILGFTLMNGIVLPFLLPYIRSRVNHTILANKIICCGQDIDRDKASLKDKLEEICKRIPSA